MRYELRDFRRPGMRVQVRGDVALWVIKGGERYGEVVKIGRKYVHVRMDDDRTLTIDPEHLLPEVSA